MRGATRWTVLLLSVARIFLTLIIDIGQCMTVQPSRRFDGRFSDKLDTENFLNKKERDLLSSLVKQRAQARARGDYNAADCLKEQIFDCISLPEGIELQICDVPRKEGGGSTWKIVQNASWTQPMEGPTVLQLAHAALGLAISSSEHQSTVSLQDLDKLVDQAKERLEHRNRVQVELRGRKAADAAFWFALAGATDSVLFDSLAEISAIELNRYGTRLSCRTKDIWHVLERLAAAGIRSNKAVEQAAMAALASKNVAAFDELTACNLLNFHSDRGLLMIWKFSTKQRKQRAFLQSALKHWEQQHAPTDSVPLDDDKHIVHQRTKQWSDFYKNSTRPLVIDIGCGMGVSLLGLAQCPGIDSESLGVDLSECNFAGVDLSGLAIGYARGLSHRWGLDDRLRFFVEDAEDFVEWVLDSYPGKVPFCLIQFPTPYRLQTPESKVQGNLQLPSDMTSGFMVRKRLLEGIHKVLRDDERGTLLIQSNCEDVAVHMRQVACDQAGFQCIDIDGDIKRDPETLSKPLRVPKRTLNWISMGGERAEGKGWITRPILPRIGRTETEVACMINNTPIHRCLLQARPS